MIMLTTDRVSGAVLAIFALGVIWESRGLPLGTFREPGPAYLPVLLAVILLLVGLLLVGAGGRAAPLAAASWSEWRHAAAILCGCAFAALAFERLGYRLTVLLVLTFLLKSVEKKSWLLTVTFALGMAIGTFYLFHTILRVPLPYGPLGI
jgi:hypothetical protein